MTQLNNIFTLRLSLLCLAVFTLFLMHPAHAVVTQQNGFLLPLGFLNHGNSSGASAVSSDGTVVVGTATDGSAGNNSRAFIWTMAAGMQSLGTFPGGNQSSGLGVNSDGSVAVGGAISGALTHAFRWTVPVGSPLQDLGFIAGDTSGQARGVNADGSVVVGFSTSAGGATHAFRWASPGPPISLNNAGMVFARATAVNADGNVVVGGAVFVGNPAEQAFRWVNPGPMVALGTLGGESMANAVTPDGSIVVGSSDNGSGNPHAVLWAAPGFVIRDLGTLAGGLTSTANAVSADGSVIIGQAQNGPGGPLRAMRWTAATGMQTVENWLRSTGVAVPADITNTANGVSADGSIVVGTLTNNEAFLAKAGNGFVTLGPFLESLATNGFLPPLVAEIGSLIMHGANGSPLSRRLTDDNEHSFWVAGDWGVLNSKGRAGLGEVGFYQRMGYHVQAGLGFGKTNDTQRLDLGGKTSLDGNYFIGHVMGELPIPIPNLWVTLSAFYFWGNFEASRGYFNAGAPEISKGKPNASMPAARARLDWDKMLTFSAMSLSPYVEASIMRIHLDAYSETGGGFPATFNVRNEKIPEARAGLLSRSPVWQCADFLVRIEGVHRFTKQGVITSGQLLDVLAFSLPGKTYKQNWLRGSLGVEQKIGQGLAALAVNATTPGQEARMWIAASYNLQF